MTKEFELKMPKDVIDSFDTACDGDFFDTEKFANLCATWGANQEYQESYNFIDDAWGSDCAIDYQESRRPKIQSEKEKAMEALEYIDQAAIDNMKCYACYESLKDYRNLLYKLIESMPDEDT